MMDKKLYFYVYILTGVLTLFPGVKLENIINPPVFIEEPPNRVDFSNSSGSEINCKADGRPPPIIRWVNQNGDVLQDLPRLRYTRQDGTLVFHPFATEEYRADIHAAVYRCVASNVVGAIGSRDVHVRAVVLQHYEIRLSDEFVLKGNMGVLRCPVPSFISDHVHVTSWERIDGFLITPGIISAKYGMLESGDLYIRDTTEHDGSYSFRCHTENVVSKEKKVSNNYSKIIVTEPHHKQPPRIIKRLTRIYVSVGGRATLPCIAQAFPIPIYRWFRSKDQRHLPDHTISVSQEGGILIFHKVVPSDSGRYVCHVTNIMGEDKLETELIVEEPYRLTITPSEIRSDVGKSATFNCSVLGSSFEKILWRKDMVILHSSSVVSFPNPFLLQIRKISRHDSGMYQCFVEREYHSAQASARLVIGDLYPTLKSVFPSKIVRPGRYISLTCTASGHPEPIIRWSLDGIWPLSTRHGVFISSYQTSNGDTVSSVNFTAVDVTDSGVYSCEASNDAGTVIYSNRLNVFGPLFIRAADNLTAISGETFTVSCPFGGYPYDKVLWKKSERTLPANQRQTVFPNGTLIIVEMQPGVDDGIYSCEVSSEQGGNPVSRSFRFVIKTKPKVSRFTFQDNLHEGMRTAVTCIVVAGDGPLTTRWLKDGFPLDAKYLDATVIPAEEGFVSTVTIRSLGSKHNGNYTCLATNEVATSSYSAVLTVKVPPRWILEPSDTSAVVGRSATIDCQAEGVPQPHVRWKLATDHPSDKFKTIVSSSHVHILVNGSLHFRNVENSDSGYYLCEANNGVGSGVSSVVRLTVYSAPHFRSKFTVLSIRRGERTAIDCSPLGDRPLKILWAKNGQTLDIQSDPRYLENTEELEETGLKATLFIDKVERKDSALFTCTASNEFGEDTLSIQLTVKDIPDAPQNLEVHDVTSRTIRLTWDRPFDGNSPITQYIVMWRQTEGNVIGGPLNVHGSENSIIVRSLMANTRYFFRVKCRNTLGESQFGAEVAVTTLEEPPRHPPRFLDVIPMSSKSVNITWQQPILEENESTVIEGYYVGYKLSSSTDPYTFIAVQLNTPQEGLHFYELYNLYRFTEYSFVVQAFNKRGAGPPSQSVNVRTLEYDLPAPPFIKSYYATSTSIKLAWESQVSTNAPVTGFVLSHRTEEGPWQETHVGGDKLVHVLHDLVCGIKYYLHLAGINNIGRGNGSETISIKTTGSAPLAPDKRHLLSVNSTTAAINLNAWHSGGCPMRFFIIQYKLSGYQEWKLVSNNINPEQQVVTLADLIPGTWYSLLMTARNDAGSTDAEYVFATLTATGELPLRPSEHSDVGSSLYKHLTITIPLVCSSVVLVVVICILLIVTKKRSTAPRLRNPDGAENSDTIKQESIALTAPYDIRQEPAYFSSHYSTGRGQSYERNIDMHPNARNIPNTGTFGSARNSYSCDTPRKCQKGEAIYETPTIYFSACHQTSIGLRSCHDIEIYEIPDRSRIDLCGEKFRREAADGNSSTESDNEELLCTLHSTDDVFPREESRESETECDRLWKSYELRNRQDINKWSTELQVS